jgi:hypothetical protein
MRARRNANATSQDDRTFGHRCRLAQDSVKLQSIPHTVHSLLAWRIFAAPWGSTEQQFNYHVL